MLLKVPPCTAVRISKANLFCKTTFLICACSALRVEIAFWESCNACWVKLVKASTRSITSVAPSLNMPANLENSAVATGLEKGQFSFQSQWKAMPKNIQTTAQLHSHHTSKVMLKFSKPGINSTWTTNFQMFKLDLEKAEEPEIKLPTFVGSSKNQEKTEFFIILS